MHVDHERGETRVLHGFGIGAHDEQTPTRQVRQRGPHLLAVGDPLLAVLHALGGQTREVGTRARLGEQLAPDFLTGEQRTQVAGLLLLAAPLDDGRAAHAVTDRVARVGVGRPLSIQAFVDQLLVAGRDAETAVTLRKVDPGESEVELLAQKIDGLRRRRRTRRQKFIDQTIDQLLFGDHG